MTKKNDSIKNNNTYEIQANLEKFLKKYQVKEDGAKLTHTAFGHPWGKFNIPDEHMEEFFDLYCAALASGKISLHITERPKKVGPLLIDIDFKFDKENNERYYKEDDIKYIIANTNSIIRRYFKCDDDKYNAYVFEKEKPSCVEKQTEEKGKVTKQVKNYKDGFHIVYPHLALSENNRYLIIGELKNKIMETNAFNHIPYINDFKDVFDISIIARNGWMMYGSRKNNGQYYYLTHIYKCSFEEKNIRRFKPVELVRILSNRQYDDEDELHLKDNIDIKLIKDKMADIFRDYGLINNEKKKKNEVDKIKPKNCDIDFQDILHDEEEEEEENEVENDLASIKSDIIKKHKSIFEEKAKKDMKNDVKMAKRFVAILSDVRAVNYNHWIRVGWALHNISDKLLNTWKEFSKRCPEEYDEKKCEKIWEKARDEGVTIGSLRCWAREDNPEKFSEILRENINDLLNNAETGTEFDIAKVVYEIYKDSYKCTSIKHSVWYEFQNHRWVEIEGAYTLSKKISEELTKEFSILNSYYYIQIAGKGSDEQEKLIKKANNVMKIMLSLKKSAFKANVLKECSILFYDPEFEEKLDSKKNLIGFNNGVYDLEARQFRNGTPDDFVSLTVGYNYEVFTLEHEYVKSIEDFFSKVQRTDEMKTYILMLMSSYLDGFTKDEQFIIWTGSGANGKSKTVELFQMAFGEYCGVLPITVLTKKRAGSNAATPEMAEMRGKRFVVFQEPENDDQIYVGYMKELTGGDWIYARPLFKDPIRFKPQFKLLLTCNKLPYIPSTDGGTWRRLRVAPWESEFVDGKPKYDYQFRKDNDLLEKMELWKKAFIWYLINIYYPKYKEQGLKKNEPKKVTDFTKKYKKQSDVFLEFIDENLMKTGNNKDFENIDVIYSAFKSWYTESYSSKTSISKKELQEYLGNNYKCNKNYLYGYKFKADEKDDSHLDD